MSSSDSESLSPAKGKLDELKSLIILTFIILPACSVLFVSAYGFIVWFSQLLLGPPGHG